MAGALTASSIAIHSRGVPVRGGRACPVSAENASKLKGFSISFYYYSRDSWGNYRISLGNNFLFPADLAPPPVSP
jgi:hypothetical protein